MISFLSWEFDDARTASQPPGDGVSQTQDFLVAWSAWFEHVKFALQGELNMEHNEHFPIDLGA